MYIYLNIIYYDTAAHYCNPRFCSKNKKFHVCVRRPVQSHAQCVISCVSQVMSVCPRLVHAV